MRVMVTGGAGYIGSHIVKLLRARGHQVVVLDNLSLGHRQAVPEECLVVGDLGEPHRLDQVMLTQRTEAVIHLAALASVPESVREPERYYRNNLINSLLLLEALRRHQVRRIVFSSTCATYGLPERVPITEETPQRPISPYGRTKLAVEFALADHAIAYGLGYAALRYFNAAGASADGSIGEDHRPESHLIPLVLKTILGQREAIVIHGTDYPTPDGTCVRDYIHVEDLAEAHLLALERIEPGQGMGYNLGTGRGYSVRDVVRIAEEVTGRPVPIQEGPRRPGDPPELVASAERIHRDLGWKPAYPELRPIIETAWNWHKAHPRGYRR